MRGQFTEEVFLRKKVYLKHYRTLNNKYYINSLTILLLKGKENIGPSWACNIKLIMAAINSIS